MNPKKYYTIFFALVTTRILVSLLISDGKVRSDSTTYLGLAVNIIEHGTFTAIMPVHKNDIDNILSVNQLYSYYSTTDSPYRRLMNYQWLHCLIYAPFIYVFKSLYVIIVLNNILFACSVLALLRLLQNTIEHLSLLITSGFILFFPPFFYLTNQILSEPLFIFLLSFVVIRCTRLNKNNTFSFLDIFAIIALSVTRGFGLFIVAGFIIYCVFKKEYRFAVILGVCGIMSIMINEGVGANTKDPKMITIAVPAQLIHSVYFSNTTNGNGDNDLYLAYPEKAEQDTFFAAYQQGVYSRNQLLAELFKQNFSSPMRFLELSFNKISAYFFNIIPDSWNYHGTQHQPLYRKILWGVQNCVILMLLALGWKKLPERYAGFYGTLFIISLTVHFVALSRYRYFQPPLVLGIPAIAIAINMLVLRGKTILFKKQNVL
jgi:hypothetical protein